MSTSSVASPPQTSEGPLQRPGVVLAVIVTAYLMVGVDSTVVNVALPDIQHDLRFSPSGLSWVLNAYTLTFGGLLLLGSRVGDIAGRRRTLTAGAALFALASLLGGLATDSGWLLAARALQGVGSALIAPSTLALITTNFAEGPKRNHALSIYTSMASIGASLGLVVGGMLTSWASWRWALLINVPIGAAVALSLPRLVREPPRHTGHFDVAGALTGTAGMTALVYGFIRVSDGGWSDSGGLVAFTAALALLVLFTYVENRAAQPIAPLRLFANRNRAAAYINVLLIPAGMFGAFFYLTQYIQKVLGYGPLRAGVSFLPLTLAMFTVLRFVPRLLQRYGPKPVLVTGALLISGSALWLTQLSPTGSYAAGLLGPMALLGLGVGMSFMPLNATILAGVGTRDAGSASGLLQTLQWLGGTLGLSVQVTVYGAATRHATGSPEAVLTHGATSAFLAGTLITLCTVPVAALAIKGRRTVRN
ncbi:MFS transporter [Streptomyces sp. NBC_01465]|uniref:MFS transporter n=1 Tax=Streptomyces sp. NBC_01465 TaxID=2903878 RepID=UPI002E2EB40B|nr:MFS transporter [Streptomyces sp. NBC_01465]